MPVLLALLAVAASAAPVYRGGFVERPEGARIAYWTRAGAGPTLVLLPGSWGDRQVFDRYIAALPSSWRAVVVELRGHGGSGPASLSPSMDMFANDVLAVIDALRLTRYFVAGHSIGGMLAIEIAGRRPAQTAGVIAMEGWTHHLVAKEAFGGEPERLSGELAQIDRANRQRVRGRLAQPEIDAFASVWRTWDGLPILASTPVPILEIWGDRGRPRPSRQAMRIPDRPGIELVWMPGASHSLLLQCPEAAAAETVRFVTSYGARTGSPPRAPAPRP